MASPNLQPPTGPNRDQLLLGLKVAGIAVAVLAAGLGGAHGFDIVAAATALAKALAGGF